MTNPSPDHLRRWIDPLYRVDHVAPLITGRFEFRSDTTPSAIWPTYRAKSAEDDVMLRGLGIKP